MSIQWGAWADVGMATRGAASARTAAMEAASGIGRISAAQGLAAMQWAVLPHAPPLLGVMPVEWHRLFGAGSGSGSAGAAVVFTVDSGASFAMRDATEVRRREDLKDSEEYQLPPEEAAVPLGPLGAQSPIFYSKNPPGATPMP